MFFVDSHCHLIFSKFDNRALPKSIVYNVSSVIKRAIDANVKYMMTVGTELSDVEELQAVVDEHENIFRTVGIHPLEAKKHRESYKDNEIIWIIQKHAVMRKTLAIGEIGLDYHYERDSERQQKELFHLQLALAQECRLPVVIHSREANDDIIEILKDYTGITGVIHCFSGEKDFANKALDLGFYVSISGVVTYKNATELQENIKYIPLDRLLIETDAPFLAPVPFRGNPNEPSFIPYIAGKISELMKIPLEIISQKTSENFFTLFAKSSPH
jgi:TatD DNase family protein